MKQKVTFWEQALVHAAVLGIWPAEFWRLSFCEWRWLTGCEHGSMSAGDLARLIEAFPDEEFQK